MKTTRRGYVGTYDSPVDKAKLASVPTTLLGPTVSSTGRWRLLCTDAALLRHEVTAISQGGASLCQEVPALGDDGETARPAAQIRGSGRARRIWPLAHTWLPDVGLQLLPP